MSAPFFSIAIPTKNRIDLLGNAIRSVLEQTFEDVEVIVCDNSDPELSGRSAAVVQGFTDRRVRYLRTSGTLSMPDNWEHAIADARGHYIGILTDRSVFRPDTLQVVRQEISRSDAPVIGWLPDHFGRDPGGRRLSRRKSSRLRREYPSRALLDYFVTGYPKYSNKALPKLMSGVCRRDVLDRIRRSPVGRVCPIVCPDYTSGYLMLAHSDRTVLMDEALFLSCGLGNGSAFRRRGALAQRFLRDLGMTYRDLVHLMPTTACFTHALVLNDFFRLQQLMPETFAGYELSRPQYYLGCLSDYFKAARQGADLTEDLDVLIEGLTHESEEVQENVRSRSLYLACIAALPAGALSDEADATVEKEDESAAVPEFDDVFSALAWSARHPQPVVADVRGTMPTLDALKRWKHQPRAVSA